MFSSLRTRFCPFFTIQHPSRGEIRGPYAKLQNSFDGLDMPLNPLKRLALDLAAILVSSRFSPTLGEGRPARRPGQTGQHSIKEATGTVTLSQAEQQSREALRIAVEKAVTGTDEESYWRGVSTL